ncbi:putative NAD kinase / phosphatase (homolog to bifunctional inositol monophosphatase / fructose 1,6-bisphosphate) [Natrialba magadii ATCC 43099]|uniref:NAD kinase n=1 Tax=Natrialba magadii (strain ATCC 43099 / DSM 3394 / CCM 3739 / CIP 104546 / IAM 13178 / JCM 8861 / NBRC 102185 / NCIMB 2190 / MS3) TaxID=547559 RepID=D3SXU2_NATMM|nr:inositol monophosphatase family protein [Natrialba magadii]ADD03982.1 putative NAD kinase / phosphatase (homolog to bifunctional inositol monophosphatase / fructose 1,6-bisphosphate) [Natrialba magadii ATCC 43099]ELY33641.1 inositol monophosphatase [Natrialba magadii ATCC 43099]
MQGRRLATTEEIVAIVSPDSDDVVARLESWTAERDISLSTVAVGDDIDHVYDENRATLGVTIGGDGTFFEGIKTFAPRNVPQIGVNTGTLAFLARVEPEDLEAALDEIIHGRAKVDSRQQVVVHGEGIDATGINDVMVEHVPPENPIDRKITQLDVYADDEYIGEFEGTGLAVSTPTGSTGISLSANGPIHYPVDNHTLQLVPLHTHQIGVRPIIVSSSTELRLVTRGPATLLVDGGRANATLETGEEVLITGAERLAHVVRTSYDDHFFTAISKKLGWGIRDVDEPQRQSTTAAREQAGDFAAESVGDDHGLPPGPAPTPSPSRAPGSDSTTPALTDGDSSTVLEHAHTIATEAAEAAGEPLRELHGQVETVDVKSNKSDIVTEADHQANRIITTVIDNEFPDHGIVSEEQPRRNGKNGYTWVVDPLDGTGNFAHGNPNYSISIALLENGTPAMGVVYVPETDELFSAIAGIGAWRDGDPIETTDRDRLDESMLISGYDPDGTFLSHFYQESRGVRRLGSAALNLCYLASGSADATWEHDTYPWDIAGGLVIARAAGATITDERGEPFVFDLATDKRTALLGSNGPLHPALLEHLGTGLPDRSGDR